MDELLNANEVAALLGVTRQRVNAIARTGEMGRKIGRDYVFRREEVEAYRTRPRQPHGHHPWTGKGKSTEDIQPAPGDGRT